MAQTKLVKSLSGKDQVICVATHLPLDSALVYKSLPFLNWVVALVYFLSKAKDEKSAAKVQKDVSEASGISVEELLKLAAHPSLSSKVDYDLPREGRVSASDLLKAQEDKKEAKKLEKKDKKVPDQYLYIISSDPARQVECIEYAKSELIDYALGSFVESAIISLDGNNSVRVLLLEEVDKPINARAEELLSEHAGEDGVSKLRGEVCVLSSKKLPFLITSEDEMEEAMDASDIKEKQKKKKAEASPKEPKGPSKRDLAKKEKEDSLKAKLQEAGIVVPNVSELMELVAPPKKKRSAPKKKEEGDSPKEKKAKKASSD
jgi:hypothetical protein